MDRVSIRRRTRRVGNYRSVDVARVNVVEAHIQRPGWGDAGGKSDRSSDRVVAGGRADGHRAIGRGPTAGRGARHAPNLEVAGCATGDPGDDPGALPAAGCREALASKNGAEIRSGAPANGVGGSRLHAVAVVE